MILLIVDVQNGIANEKLYCFKQFVLNIKTLIRCARENNIEVIYVRHDDGRGSLSKGNRGFEIYDEVKPIGSEKIIDKTVNSAFNNTGLVDYLNTKGDTTVIIAGLQTDYCMDATIKCGFEHGLKMVVPAFSNSTIDNKYMSAENSYKYYNEFMWNKRYAQCISLQDTLALMQGKDSFE